MSAELIPSLSAVAAVTVAPLAVVVAWKGHGLAQDANRVAVEAEHPGRR